MKAASNKLVAVVSFVLSVLSDEKSTLADWQDGWLGGVAGVDYPATALTAPVATSDTTITVASTVGFTIGATGAHVGYLAMYDGTYVEIASYTYSTGTTFTGLTRGLYGTSPRVYAPADFVFQLLPGLGGFPDYNLTVNKKNWIQPTAAGGPPTARIGAKMIYATSTGLYYLFGGYDPVGLVYLNDLWTFDPATNTWALLAPAGGPPALRAYFVMAYNPTVNQIWVTSGLNAGGGLQDTWKYDIVANTWATNVAWNVPGGAVYDAMGCYVPSSYAGEGMFVIGGRVGIAFRTGVYLFTGSTWYGFPPFPPLPVGLANGSATYIESTGQILLIGIQNNFYTQITYLWNPVTIPYWNATTVSPLPTLRIYHSTAYDNINGRVLLFGGETTFGGAVAADDLYSYNPAIGVGGTWTVICPYLRENRTRHVAAFDIVNYEMLVWGGAQNVAAPLMPAFIHPMRFKYYWQSAKYITSVIDLGQVPDENGEWILEDITDTTYDRTFIDYTGEWSDTGLAPWINIGTVADGDIVTIFHRYWQAQINLQNNGLDNPPEVTLVDVNHDVYQHFSMASTPIGDYPPLVKSINAFTSKVDIMKCQGNVGTTRIELVRSGMLTDKILMDNFPRKKPVRIKIGYDEDDMSISDFMTVLVGRTDNWQLSADQLVVTSANYLDDLLQDIPLEDLTGIVTPLDYSIGGIATNPVDILLDIIQNQVNIADRYIDFDSFNVVKVHSSISGWQFVRDICCPTDAKKLAEELCRHIGAALIPLENGKLSLKLFDPDDTPVTIWNELDHAFLNPQFDGKADSIRNYISTWWEYDGDGDEVTDWTGIEIATDATSITRHGSKILRTKSKWLGRALPPPSPPYAGDVLALVISDRILDMSKNGLQEIKLRTNMSTFETQVGDLISVQSSIIRSNEEYKRWQRDNDNERNKMIIDILNGCDVADWTQDPRAAPEVLNSINKIYGANSLDLGKDNHGGAAFQFGYTRTILSHNPNNSFSGMWLRIKAAAMAVLRNDPVLSALRIVLRTNAGNYYHKTYLYSELGTTDIWTRYGDDFPSNWTIVGIPDPINITSLQVIMWTNLAADLIASGDIIMDHWSFIKEQIPANIVGRYSIPYVSYGVNECIDMKFWVTSKSVNFAKGEISWVLVRARQVPLAKELTSQANWYEGQGQNIDLETTPGSVLIAIDVAPNYYQFAWGITFIDLGQQPEQDGYWEFDNIIPVDTGIVYEAWSSETGKFDGEENYMGIILDGDTVTIKSRYYKLQATMHSDVARLTTPQIDRVLISFDLG